MTVLTHDYLLVHRGAERVFLALARLWPQAPIATLLYDESVMGGLLAGREIRTSSLQRLGAEQRTFRRLLPLYPLAVSRLDVAHHALVVSSSSAFAHGVRVDEEAAHVCYCHTPFRYAWYERERALSEAPRAARPALNGVLEAIRRWDRRASARVTRYVAPSDFARERIAQAYGRDAEVVHPPVELDRFAPGIREDYLLVVTELVRHKRVELALAAAKRAGVAIRVVGTGPDFRRLHALYADSALFLGRVSDPELARLYAGARALLVPNVEEFGIAAVEAQASGCPVIAADAGGARETVLHGVTGLLLPVTTEETLAEAICGLDGSRLEPSSGVTQARRFSEQAFRDRFTAVVATVQS